MAFCIGLWLRDTSLKLRQHGIDLNKRALSQFQKQIVSFIQVKINQMTLGGIGIMVNLTKD
jgi:hypothetical protein